MSTPKDGFCNAGAGHEGTRNAHNSKYPSPEAHLHAMPGAYFNKFLECCYAHTEVWCKTGGEFVDEPSRKVRETFRVKLALRMTVRIPASR